VLYVRLLSRKFAGNIRESEQDFAESLQSDKKTLTVTFKKKEYKNDR